MGDSISSIENYLLQKISVQEAAARCKIPLSDFMDFLAQLGIGSQLDLDDVLMGFDFLSTLNKEEN
jgi:hypothetical protein